MLEQTHIYREIHEQPAALDRLLTGETRNIQQLAAAIKDRDIQHVVIAARGTSDNAGRYAQYLLGAVNSLPVGLTTPSLFSIYKRPPRFGNALVLGISQSGKSPDIISVLVEARRQGALTAAITNSVDSGLAGEVEHVIDIQAGPEVSVAGTKSYTSELLAIAFLSAVLADDAEMLESLQQVPQAVATVLANSNVPDIVQRYRYMQVCAVIGRGYNYATAFEMALKVKELTFTIAESYSSADFLHGPIALVDHGFPAMVIAPSGAVLPQMQEFIQTLARIDAEILVVSDDASTLSMADISVELPPGVPEWLSPITAIVPGQLFAMNLAYIRHYDVDNPRGLLKVTKTQ